MRGAISLTISLTLPNQLRAFSRVSSSTSLMSKWTGNGLSPAIRRSSRALARSLRKISGFPKELYYFLNTPFVNQMAKKVQKIGDMHKLSWIELSRCDIDGDKSSHFGDKLKNV